MFETYFIGQICKFRCGGSDIFEKVGRIGSNIGFRLFGKCSSGVFDGCAN